MNGLIMLNIFVGLLYVFAAVALIIVFMFVCFIVAKAVRGAWEFVFKK